MTLKVCFGVLSLALAGVIAAGCSSSENGNNNGGNDGGPADAAPDVKKDASPIPGDDDDAGDSAAPSCSPSDQAGFQPKWHGPTPKKAVCSDAQIKAFHSCLNDSQTNANPPSCAPFTGSNVTAANKACLACIQTNDTAATYGPLVAHKGTVELNLAGCIALTTNDLNGTGCAGKYQAASQCKNAACASCVVTDNASFQAQQACQTAAASGTCATQQNDAACVEGLVDGGAAVCFEGSTFDDRLEPLINVFCGGAEPADGGTDATPSDAATDAAPADATPE